MMTKNEFLLEWAKEVEDLTSYKDHPKVKEYWNRFYPNENNQDKVVSNLVYEFGKLVKSGVLRKSVCVGLGANSKILNFSSTRQYFWRVLK